MKQVIWRILVVALFFLILQPFGSAEVWTPLLEGSFHTALTNTPKGLVVGDFDTSISQEKYNGLYVSKNFGLTWNNAGLVERGITDISFWKGKLYAGTYYVVGGIVGLFVSEDFGATWNKIGPHANTSSVAVDDYAIYLGTYSRGLWVSVDSGLNFVQKIGDGTFGPRFFDIESNGKVTIAASTGKTYRSIDGGNSWIEIPDLNGKQFKNILFAKDKIFVGSYDTSGLYVSNDSGVTWSRLINFGTTPVDGLSYYQNTLYAGRYDATSAAYSIYKSVDFGKTWQSTNLDLPSQTNRVTKITWVYTEPAYLIASILGLGIYKMEIPPKLIEAFKFLDVPWQTSNPADVVDKISSFFDHRYPLLGYLHYSEPSINSNSTLNFLGREATEPELYYTSHSGIDFALPYGTEIKAPAAGMASYTYCTECGYSIKIDHLNGYQTIYQHLQKDRLITTSEKVPVLPGDIIGKVGLSGRTSGAHLHFEVSKDTNLNGLFTDDFPHGRVDPFGWLDTELSDPWDGYFWVDAFGQHTGQESKYLWNATFPQLKSIFVAGSNEQKVVYENKSFDLSNVSELAPFNFSYKSFSTPRVKGEQSGLKYLPNTSFILEMSDTMKNRLEALPKEILIKIDFSANDVSEIRTETLKIYYFDVVGNSWQPLATTVDMTTKTLSAQTDHLTQFAVFYEAIDTSPPKTLILLEGEKSGDWFITPPTISLYSESSDLDKTFYSIDNGSTWEEYSTPFQLTKVGVTNFLFQSNDKAGNYEEVSTQVIKFDPETKWLKTLRISDVRFSTL